jgi:hypothetical protein
MRAPRRRSRSYFAAAGSLTVVAAVAVLLGVVVTGASSQSFSDQIPKVSAAFEGAMVTFFTMSSPVADDQQPASAVQTEPRLSPITNRISVADGIPPKTSAAQVEATRKRASENVHKYFAPAEAERVLTLANQAIDLLGDASYRDLGSGVSKILIRPVDIDATGSSATVDAVVTHWVSGAISLGDGGWQETHPSGDVIVTAKMVEQASGVWIVERWIGRLTPDSAP